MRGAPEFGLSRQHFQFELVAFGFAAAGFNGGSSA